MKPISSTQKKALLVFVLLAAACAVYLTVTSGTAETNQETRYQRSIQGRIVSAYGPVARARVRIAGEEEYTLTSQQGEFELGTGHIRTNSLKLTAGKEGWFSNGRQVATAGHIGEIGLYPLPRGDQPDYQFASPRACAQCHTKLADYWSQAKMASTTSNPKLHDLYYGRDVSGQTGVRPGYKLDNPGKEGNCASCHAPSAAATPTRSKDLLNILRSKQTEWNGISCDYCHKIRKVIKDKDRPSLTKPVLKRQAPIRGRSFLVLGPLDDVVNPAMSASFSPLYDQGSYCSSCHSHIEKTSAAGGWDRSRVYTDSEWEGFGLNTDSSLPIQTTYQEWKNWQEQLPAGDPDKGKSCQDCHMSWRKDMLPYDHYLVEGFAKRSGWATKRSPENINPHVFEGTSETQLKSALSMEVSGEISNSTLKATVYITNAKGGHWVPTGETMRSLMLTVKAVDSSGQPLKPLTGTRLPDWTGTGDGKEGDFKGRPGAVFARVLEDGEGNLHVPFWKATAVAFDTRIRPKQTRTLEFTFALEDPLDEPTVKAGLIYRPVVAPLARAKGWSIEDTVIAQSVW